jgi:hypothetical protein
MKQNGTKNGTQNGIENVREKGTENETKNETENRTKTEQRMKQRMEQITEQNDDERYENFVSCKTGYLHLKWMSKDRVKLKREQFCAGDSQNIIEMLCEKVEVLINLSGMCDFDL